MLGVDGGGLPLTLKTESAQVSEYNLALPILDSIKVEKHPLHPKKRANKIIADRGYDAKWLRKEIRKRGMRPIIPKRRKPGKKEVPKVNTRIKTEYVKRWPVERTFAWLGNYRRVLIRWEHYDTIYTGFLNIACIMLCLGMVLK